VQDLVAVVALEAVVARAAVLAVAALQAIVTLAAEGHDVDAGRERIRARAADRERVLAAAEVDDDPLRPSAVDDGVDGGGRRALRRDRVEPACAPRELALEGPTLTWSAAASPVNVIVVPS
jgi:hypothetical protein